MRKRRILLDEATYHVTARVNRKELALQEDNMKELFLTVLCRAKNKFRFSIFNMVIMGNHYHMLIKPGRGESLSEIMKWIQQTTAIRYNRAHGLTGHFWGDRFFSWIIPNLLSFIRTFHYIDENPIRAGLIKIGGAWPWGLSGLKQRLSWLFDDPPDRN